MSNPSYRRAQPVHPATLILLWSIFAVALQFLSGTMLLLVGMPLLLAACALGLAPLFTLLRRTRWIMLSIFIVYAYSIPGEAAWTLLGGLSPTMEGVNGGATQLSRLIFMLAALSLLLSLLSQAQLISGLYTLAYPLSYAGVSRTRIAVRLALTLRYAESSMMAYASNWREYIERALAQIDDRQHAIELQAVSFTLLDGLLVALGCALLLLLIFHG